MDVVHVNQVEAFTTMDGSQIRELLSHRNSSIRYQSLAEARVPAGTTTVRHHHPKTEEIYFILEGAGEMTIDGETKSVGVGEAIAIPPGASHCIHNLGPEELRFLCCCVPGYEHDDTVLEE